MKIKTVSTVLTMNTAGQVVESLPVWEVPGPVLNSAGQWVDAVDVEEAPDGVPVRFVDSAIAINSVGQPVAATPVKGVGVFGLIATIDGNRLSTIDNRRLGALRNV